MTIKISQLGNLTAVLGNVLVPTVANVAGTLTTVKANINQIAEHIVGSGNYVYGNVIPSANVTYNLGSPSAQWKDLYLSGSTIYIGGAQISVANGAVQSSVPIVADITANTLTVADTQLTFSQGSYIDETEVLGQPGVYGLALNSPDDGIVGMNALDANATVMSSVIVSNVSVQVNVQNTSDPANVHVWTYLEDGSLLWPDSELQSTAFSQTYIDQINNTDANVTVLQGNVVTIEDDILNLQANAAVQAGEIAAVAANVGASSYSDSNVASYLEIYTGNISAGTISTDGLEIGGNYTFTSDGPNIAIRQALVANASSQLEWVDYFGRIEFDALIVTYIPNYPGNANSFVSTPTRVEAREYVVAPNVFAANLTSISGLNTANIRFFDNSLQTTAYTDAFTMANSQHWTSNVTTISAALNQLAERIWNIENP